MTALVKLTGRYTETDVDDEVVIMRLDNGEFFALSGTAAAIWRLIDGESDRAVLIATLSDQFTANDTEIAADLDEFIGRLKVSGLLAGG